MDFLPTLCEITGAQVGQPVDGQSLANVWMHGGAGEADRTMIWVRREGSKRYQGRAYYAARKGPWKLQQSSPFEPMMLVNLVDDPLEMNPQPAQGKIATLLQQHLMLHLQCAGQIPWQARSTTMMSASRTESKRRPTEVKPFQ